MESGKSLGRVHVITGPGKGKTTAAFGLALRAAGHGLRVQVIQFMKTGMTTGELLAVKRIREIQVHQFGTGRFLDPKKVADEDRRFAGDAMVLVRSFLEKGGCDVLILDEINVAANYGLVERGEVLSILKSRKPGIEVILTGRNAPQEFVDYADYVSYIDSRKHPFKEGLKAREGIEW
jgi:cob(I)alamin adenosyltransferase